MEELRARRGSEHGSRAEMPCTADPSVLRCQAVDAARSGRPHRFGWSCAQPLFVGVPLLKTAREPSEKPGSMSCVILTTLT